MSEVQMTAVAVSHPKRWPILLFLVVAILHALVSSSTPDEVDWPEVVIGALLVVLVGFYAAIFSIGGFMLHRSAVSLAYVAFFIMVFVPSVVALARGNSMADAVRDLIPLLYFFLPVLLWPRIQENPVRWRQVIVLALCLIGVSYSIRHFMSDEAGLAALGEQVIFGGMNYFPQDPAVLFASSFLIFLGLSQLATRSMLRALPPLGLGLIAFASIVGIVVRGQIALVILSATAFAFYLLVVGPSRWRIVLLVSIAGSALAWMADVHDVFEGVWNLISDKFQETGVLNMRDVETAAVIALVMNDPLALLFGTGWGGLTDSVYGEPVRFTHNVFLYGLMKGGIVGLVATVIYCLVNVHLLLRLTRLAMRTGDLLGLAIAAAATNVFIIHLMLEPGFKMLSLGLVFSLLWVCSLGRFAPHVIAQGEGQRDSHIPVAARPTTP